MAGMVMGGLTDPAPATPEVQEIANKMKDQLEEKTNASYSKFQAVLYRSQVVAGTNYFIKVRHGNGERDYVHIRVFEALPCNGGALQLSSYELGKTREDPITYF